MAFADRLGPASRAIVLMILAMFVITLLDSLAKELSTRYHSLQVVWGRFASQAALSLLFLAPKLTQLLRTKYIGLQVIRSSFLFMATIFFFFGIGRLPLATAAAIFEVAPLVITFAAFFVLKEQVGSRRWIAVAVGMAGALIIIRPGSAVFTPNAFFPLAAACCYAGYAVSTRMLSAEESPWTSFLYTALLGTVGASFLAPWVWITPNLTDTFLFVLLGAIGSVGHFLIIKSFSSADASIIAPFGYFGLFFNALWGFLFFAEVPGLFTWIGSVVIVGAGLYVWQREIRDESKATMSVGNIGDL